MPSLDVFIAESTSDGLAPTFDYTEGVYCNVATSSSDMNPITFQQTMYLLLPHAESVSAGGKVIVKAMQKVSENVQIAESESRAFPPSFNMNGGAVLSVRPAESYSEFIDDFLGLNLGEPVKAYPTVAESNSEGLLATLTLNIMDMISGNDDIYLLVMDEYDNYKVYRARVRDIQPQDRQISIKGIMGDGILAERIVREDFDEQDVGLTVKEIIDKYCSPLTSVGVNVNTGYFAPIKAKGETALSVIEKIRKDYNLSYFVGFDWDMRLYKEETLLEGSKTIRLGDW